MKIVTYFSHSNGSKFWDFYVVSMNHNRGKYTDTYDF